MKKALIDPRKNNRICEVVTQAFPVASPLVWVDCPATANTNWTFDGLYFSPPVEPVPVPTSAKYSSLEFLEKFTEAEQLAVVSATLSNAQVKLWYDKMLAASFVDTADQRTVNGLSALVSAGLLTEQRKQEILG